MISHDFLTQQTAKMVEYLIAVLYLLLFVPFWRFVNGRSRPAPASQSRSKGGGHA